MNGFRPLDETPLAERSERRLAKLAAVTARTDATAVAVSETDGYVRVFADGKLVLQMDPELTVL